MADLDYKKVKIYISGIDISQAIRPLIQSFFGNIEYEYAYVSADEINYGGDEEASGELSVRCGFSEIEVFCRIAANVDESGKTSVFTGSLEEMPEDIAEYRYAAGRLIYDMLHKLTGKTLPWGVMIGIRPTKHAYEALENGKSEIEIKERFEKELYVSNGRAELSIDIARRELDILRSFDYRNGYSLYIGIPFCPTTCLYCSFTSYPVEKFGHLMNDYLTSLEREMAYASTAFSGVDGSKKKYLNTIYIGGGTPTALSEAGLERLLTAVHKYFPVEKTLEFCVEAGRPDSLNPEKLRILKKYGVNRISINPQSMNQKTLDLIGRKHSVEQVYEAFKMARAEGHENINLDMIIGLHGETPEDVAHTLSCVKELDPESLTVHTLAIKRAARLKLENDRYKDMAAKNVEEAAELTMRFAAENDYHPYYLYRQKNMAENLENIGYAREGKEGPYNILIMEEKQTILALGAGATTKYVFPEVNGETRIERVENVKSLTDYIGRVDEMIERKREAFRAWN